MPGPNVEKRFKVAIEAVEKIPDLKIIKPKVFPDDRGFFAETYNKTEWAVELNYHEDFKQDNHSFSVRGVLRGLHAQPGMGKLVSVISGEIYDVAVDIRKDSPTYGQWHAEVLSGENKHAYWIPDGFLHAFQCISDEAHVTYKCTSEYNPKIEFGVNPLDLDLAIAYPLTEGLIISEKDKQNMDFKNLANRK